MRDARERYREEEEEVRGERESERILFGSEWNAILTLSLFFSTGS